MAFPIANERGRRWVGDVGRGEVHDLERAGARCRIDEIITSARPVGFYPDTLGQARDEGYAPCVHCVRREGRLRPAGA